MIRRRRRRKRERKKKEIESNQKKQKKGMSTIMGNEHETSESMLLTNY